EALPLLVEALKDPEVQVRSNVAYVLAQLKDLPSEAVPLLIECTVEPDDGLRLNAVRALTTAADDTVTVVLPGLIEDPNSKVRLLAACFLLTRDTTHAKAAEILTTTLADPAVRLHTTTLELIEALGPGAAVFHEVIARRAGVEEDRAVRDRLSRIL